MANTKIVATVGPSSYDPDVLRAMMESGLDTARINMTHTDKEKARDIIRTVDRIRTEERSSFSILADTQGPEIQVRTSTGDSMRVREGEQLSVFPREEKGASLLVDYPSLHRYLNKGNKIYLGDGEVELVVSEIDGERISCTVTYSGLIPSEKGIHIPDIRLPLPTITEKDREEISFLAKQGIDWLAVSFVRDAGDIQEARELLLDEEENAEDPTLIIAKIETTEALENIDEIIEEADGIMVARGDLGIAVDMEEVPFIQKQIIRLANRSAKPVITATQMLESMIEDPVPSRAEAADVANAVLDGTDALMLSAETAVGSFPVKTVQTMHMIAEKAETNQIGLNVSEDSNKLEGVAPAIGRSACAMADRLNAKAIISSTRSGYTARLIARYRPRLPILAVTPSIKVYRQLSLVWGVESLLIEDAENTDQMIKMSIKSAVEEGYLEDEDVVVITAGVPFAVRGTTNLIKVERVGESPYNGASD